jgi:hypothetical protein
MTRFVKENSQIPKRSDEDRFAQRSTNKFQTLNPSQKSWTRNRTQDPNIFFACVQSLIIWLQRRLAPSQDHATKPQFRLHFQQEAKARKCRVEKWRTDCTHTDTDIACADNIMWGTSASKQKSQDKTLFRNHNSGEEWRPERGSKRGA